MPDPGIPPESAAPRSPAVEMPAEYPRLLAEAVFSRADADVELLVEFLRQLGREPVVNLPPAPAPVALNLMKLAAALRVSRWEAAGLTPFLEEAPPSADAVFDDLTHHPRGGVGQAYPAGAVATQVLGTYLAEMAWQRPGQFAADVVVNRVDGNDVVDPVAELLWQFRHLVHGEQGNTTVAPLVGGDSDPIGEGNNYAKDNT